MIIIYQLPLDGLVTLTHETIKELPVPKSQTYGARSKTPIVAPKPQTTLKVLSQRKPVIRPVILRYVAYDIPLDKSYRILQRNVHRISANWVECALLVEETHPIIISPRD